MITHPDATTILPTGLLIDGARCAPTTADAVDHVNPSTGKPQIKVALASARDIDTAVAAAKSALPGWAAWHPSKRRNVLLDCARRFRRAADDLVPAIALETGSPVTGGRALIELAATWTEGAAVCIEQLHGQVINHGPGVLDYTLVEPVGVVAVILTWNAPVGSFGMCVAPALAAGCTVVVKPSELAPFTSVLMAQICEQAGIPPGVINVAPGLAEAGAALVEHPDVAKISFTGGGPTARRIAAAAGAQLKPLLLELGGKSANLVFDDADIPTAVNHALSIVGLAGQGCTLPSRLLVQRSIYEPVVAAVGRAMAGLPVGDPLDAASLVGPVISAGACDRILGIIGRAQDEARVVVGGHRLGGDLADGYFISPTAFADVSPDSELARDEVFGPVLSIIPFDDEDEAISIANATEFGLAAYVHTANVSRVHRLAAQLQAGSVGVNGAGVPAGPHAPFGGIKQSGYGREGGVSGLLEFASIKNVAVGL